jgi:hypothetical protein
MSKLGSGRGMLEGSSLNVWKVNRSVDEKWEYRLRWLDDIQNDLGEVKGKRQINRE